MEFFKTITALKKKLSDEKKHGRTIGLVPTMGALHVGHLELVRKSITENSLTVVSIFVNPIQFNIKEDLLKYPRDLASDLEKLKSVGCDYVFAPETTELYPEPDLTRFDFGQLDKVMEGKFRPGHFYGVAIVVKKLFEIIEPDQAYFGEKDFQQLTIIKRLVEMEKMSINIIPCEIVREADGLAMSSRNVRLSKNERDIAPQIYKTLKNIKKTYPVSNISELLKVSINLLNSNDGLTVEYLEIVDAKTLNPIKKPYETNEIIACIAVNLGNIRLIDNLKLT